MLLGVFEELEDGQQQLCDDLRGGTHSLDIVTNDDTTLSGQNFDGTHDDVVLQRQTLARQSLWDGQAAHSRCWIGGEKWIRR